MIKIVFGTLVIAGIGIYFLRYIETRTLFYPTKEIAVTPDAAGLAYRDIVVKTSDKVDINAWLIPCDGAEFVILFCHGNAGNIGHRIEKLKFFHELGCAVFIVDYRGYGKSMGKPSEKGFYRDAAAAYRYLVSHGYSPDKIIGYGESIGGAVIVDLASKVRLRAVILDSTLSSVKDMIESSYAFVPYWIFSSRFDSENKIKVVTVPKLMIHSINDEIIPFRLGKKLYDNAPGPKEFLQIAGGHNSNFFESKDTLRSKISAFIKGLSSKDHVQ
jgi:hypothetical protein